MNRQEIKTLLKAKIEPLAKEIDKGIALQNSNAEQSALSPEFIQQLEKQPVETQPLPQTVGNDNTV